MVSQLQPCFGRSFSITSYSILATHHKATTANTKVLKKGEQLNLLSNAVGSYSSIQIFTWINLMFTCSLTFELNLDIIILYSIIFCRHDLICLDKTKCWTPWIKALGLTWSYPVPCQTLKSLQIPFFLCRESLPHNMTVSNTNIFLQWSINHF